MSVKFNQIVAKMPELLQALERQPFLTRDNLFGIPKQGVYILYENNKPIHVGRSNRIKFRIREHSQPSSTHNSAPFAFNLAKEEIRRYHSIPTNATRKELAELPEFDKPFSEAKQRVARMKIRFIEIDDQIEQTLFEVYAALALNTKYNDFSTH